MIVTNKTRTTGASLILYKLISSRGPSCTSSQALFLPYSNISRRFTKQEWRILLKRPLEIFWRSQYQSRPANLCICVVAGFPPIPKESNVLPTIISLSHQLCQACRGNSCMRGQFTLSDPSLPLMNLDCLTDPTPRIGTGIVTDSHFNTADFA
jgi:hypothetical protein